MYKNESNLHVALSTANKKEIGILINVFAQKAISNQSNILYKQNNTNFHEIHTFERDMMQMSLS